MTAAGPAADPVTVEIIKGVLASVEAEVEEAIARTARSPMIRDAHDFRAGIHDARLRKLTGRSYSALVHPVVRDFPLGTMRPGDVYFHNDVYTSEGGIGHLPDLCVTVPVFHDDGTGPSVVAFVQAFGHHDDIGGAVPGSMPSHATSVFEEGLMVPPIKLWDAGVPNRAALTILTRNSRLPDSLAGDLDAEANACRMGAERLAAVVDRYGRATFEACVEEILAATTRTYRREVLSRIPDGSWTWEDYAEHDGVDPPRLHRQRITLTTLPGEGPDDRRLRIDFTGTGPQARGPINHAGDYADGNFLKKWLAPVLRTLAADPERMAELDVDEGVVELIEMVFPAKGTLLTPVFPAPTNARTFVILRLLGVFAGVLAEATGGQVPADQETIRYTGVHGLDDDGVPYLFREVLGGGSGGKPWADGEDTIHIVPDSRNIPAEFVESRFPLRVERLGLAVDSGGPGRFRGGLGYDKHIRVLRDARFMSIADRSILSCWGVNGGRAGAPFRVTIDPGGPREREMEGLVDDAPVAAGEVIRIRTTGGGGWGDPLDREPERVLLDVVQGKVSAEAAERDYGVVLTLPGVDTGTAGAAVDTGTAGAAVDRAGTEALRRSRRRLARPWGMFDRGPGHARLAAGESAAAHSGPGTPVSAPRTRDLTGAPSADGPRRPLLVAHGDWSTSPGKRWMAVARVGADGTVDAAGPEPVGDTATLLARLRDRAGGDPVLLGLDVVIGLPLAYARLVGVTAFRPFLQALAEQDDPPFFQPARSPEEISLRRPFYPARPGGTAQRHLVDGLGLDHLDQLRRRCELATATRRAASPLFWILGAQQVGRAAITVWRDLLVPAVRSGDDVGIWPFDGPLDRLLEARTTVIAETYPTAFQAPLDVRPGPGGKRDRTARLVACDGLRASAARLGVDLAPDAVAALDDGFGHDAAGEDRFDAVVGLLGMLAVLDGDLDPGPPADLAADDLAVEGWMLGQG